MQSHFTYDELTPLEQCIANFMSRQELQSEKASKKTKATEPKRQ